MPQFFLQVHLKLKPGKIREFAHGMNRLIPTVFEQNGFQLLAASYNITGDVGQVLHYWAIESPDALPALMEKLAETPQYVELHSLVESEVQEICEPMPYDPNHGPASSLARPNAAT